MKRLKKNLKRDIIDSMPIGSLLDNQSKMNKTLKRHLISAGVTFLTSFGIVVLANIDNITLLSIKDGAIVGLVFTALRSAVKATLEFLLSTYTK